MRPARGRSLGIGRLPTPAWATLTLLLGLFAAAPAQAQVWSATLTVDQDDTYFGCDNTTTAQDDCSRSTVLTEDDFTYGGTTYTVAALFWQSNTDRLFLNIDNVNGQATKTALSGLTLNVDGTALAVSAATVETGFIYWSYDPSPDWTDGQTVSLSLTLPPGPTGLTVTPGNAKLDLSWTAPTGTVTGYDVQYTSAPATGNGAVVNSATATGSNPATAWVAVTRSGTTASQTISSLSNNTAYRVRVRAKTSSANSAWVFGSGTPAPTPTITLSVSRTSVPAGENVTLTVTLSSAQAGWVNVNLGSQAGTAYWRKYSVGSSIYIEAGQTTGTTTISTNTDLQSLGTFKVFISGLQKHTNVGNLINATPSSAPLTITITASRNADLAALSATQAGSAGGTYSALDIGAFAAATTSYTATVPHATTHVKLTLRGKDESSGYITCYSVISPCLGAGEHAERGDGAEDVEQ